MSEKFPGNNLRVNSLLPLEIAICFWFISRWWHHPFSPSISLNSSFSLLLAFCLFFFNHHRTKQAQSPSRKLERVMSKCLRQPKKKQQSSLHQPSLTQAPEEHSEWDTGMQGWEQPVPGILLLRQCLHPFLCLVSPAQDRAHSSLCPRAI